MGMFDYLEIGDVAVKEKAEVDVYALAAEEAEYENLGHSVFMESQEEIAAVATPTLTYRQRLDQLAKTEFLVECQWDHKKRSYRVRPYASVMKGKSFVFFLNTRTPSGTKGLRGRGKIFKCESLEPNANATQYIAKGYFEEVHV